MQNATRNARKKNCRVSEFSAKSESSCKRCRRPSISEVPFLFVVHFLSDPTCPKAIEAPPPRLQTLFPFSLGDRVPSFYFLRPCSWQCSDRDRIFCRIDYEKAHLPDSDLQKCNTGM